MKATKSPSGVIGTTNLSGSFTLGGSTGGQVTTVGGITTFGNPGVSATVAIYTSGSTNAAITNGLNYATPAQAGKYILNVVVDCTVGTTTSLAVQVGYKDFRGVSHTDTVTLINATTPGVLLTNALVIAAGYYYAIPVLLAIDNSATAITLSTVGTFTTVTYFVDATLEKIG